MDVFLVKLLELSLQAGVLTLAILLVRFVFRKLPAKYLCLLWLVVAARLVIPVSIESGAALMPSLKSLVEKYAVCDTDGTVDVPGKDISSEKDYYIGGNSAASRDEVDYYPEISDGVVITEQAAGADSGIRYDEVSVSPTPVPEKRVESAFPLNWQGFFGSILTVRFGLWLLGVLLLFGYGVYSCQKVKELIKNAIPYEGNIRLCEGLETPFLFGWHRPQIFIPTNLEEKEIHYVVAHENAHIARGDQYTKLFGFVLLAVYWFNPLIWIAYVTFCKDVERACDEKVIGGLTAEERKEYAEALLKCSTDSRTALTNPLAFGETDVKKRIVDIMKFKKPRKWLAAFALFLCVAAVGGCFLVRKETQGEMHHPVITPTATPTPTMVPVAESTATVKHTPTPLPPSDLSLLGNCSAETVLPVPFGQTVIADLDGDGTEESVTFGLEGYEGNVSLRDLEEAHMYTYEKVEDLYYLKINDQVWTQPDIEEEFWSHYGVGTTTYYIFDVDTSDKYKEIGIFFPGPNTPTGIALYRYFNGELYCIGNFMSAVLEADHGYGTDSLPYEEMVANVNREGYLITVPGDGTILCEERRDCMETSFTVLKYKLDSASSGRYARLKEVLRERYEFSGWQEDRGEYNIRAAKDFYAYLEPVDMSEEFHKDLEAVKIPEGTRISFVAYYPDNEWTAGWVQFAYGENLENFAWLYKGVDPRGKGMIYLPETKESNPDEMFRNLSKAG